MPTNEEVQERVKILSTEIIKLLMKIDPRTEDTDREMQGIAIIMCPKDHAETGDMRYTMMGRMCASCLMQCVMEAKIIPEGEQNPLAT